MKKLFTLIAVAVLAFAAQAATLTVADGTNYNGHYPFYGLYYDTQGTTSQVIYPAYMLTDMVGKEITKLEFYATEPIGVTGGNLEYALDVVEESEFATATAFELSGNAKIGHCVPVNGETMFVIDLEEPFVYEGGNLLLQTVVEVVGGYRSVYFYGEATGLYGAFYQYQGWSGVNAYTEAFLPKCTFTFEESTTPVEPPVEPVTVGAPVFQGYTIDGITGYGVGITPTTEGSEIMYRVLIWDPVAEEWVLRTDWTLYEGTEGEIWFENNGEKVRIEAYAFIGQDVSQDVAYEFTVATALDELMSGKTVAGVRYFNMAGQEMQQAEGLTIVVTTYIDGTTNAVKVVK